MERLFDAALITWLTSVPPDRVGVSRQLRLGGTLKATSTGGFDLDLSTPDAHKTAAVFGPCVTAVPDAAAKLLTAWVKLAKLDAAARPYVFGSGDHAHPAESYRWTRMVKAMFKRHAGVALAPKELRSSYVTFLRSEANSDEALKRAAWQMRHSERQAAGPAYDKERAQRLSAAAVRAAGASAARF